MRVKLLSCSILFLANSVFASDGTIYKWVDDKGIVHFSNSHPANKSATIVDIQVAYSASNEEITESDNLETSEDERLKNEQYIARTEKNAKMFAENCKSAQANKKILTGFKKILIQDENGVDKLLTGDDITAQLSITNKHIDIYCEAKK